MKTYPLVRGKVAVSISNLSDFDSIQGIGNLPLLKRFQQFSKVIESTVSEPYRDFFAEPVLGEEDTIIWYSLPYSETPQRYTTLDSGEKEKYDKIKQVTLTAYEGALKHLKDQNRTNEAEYLEKALRFTNDNFIYCFDDKVVLVAWGMKPRLTTDKESGLYIQDAFPPRERPLPVAKVEDSIQEEVVLPPVYHTIVFDLGENAEFNNQSRQYRIEVEKGKALSETDIPDFTVKDGYEFKGWAPAPIGHIVEDDFDFHAEFEKREETPIPPATPPNKPPWWVRLWNAIANFFRKYWKLLLFLLLLLLLLLLLSTLMKSCERNDIQWENPLTDLNGNLKAPWVKDNGLRYLPPEPLKQMPVDTLNFGYSRDSLTYIVKNRLNILLEGNTKVEDFVLDFKRAYPGKQHQIIYYDTLIKRIQILVPENERERIKRELPQKLHQYTIFIWDESLFETSMPNDPALQNPEQSWLIAACRVPEAWEITMGSGDITIAIIDDGFNLEHPEFINKVVMPYNVITKNSSVYPSKTHHGNHVAGIALAVSNNSIGIAGIASACKFMPVQVSDKNGVMTITSILDGILYAIYKGADVINVSLCMKFTGALQNMPPGMQRSIIRNNYKEEERLWNEVFKIAEQHNVTIVLAVGNDNVLAGIDPIQRNSAGIKVAAVDKQKNPLIKSDFSNYGEFSTVSAPGESIYSTFNKGFGYLSGTSMAAPVVSGAVALMKSVNKGIGNDDIVKILITTGLPVNGNIGNMVQLGPAVKAAFTDVIPPKESKENDCDEINRKIEALRKEIEILMRQCPSAGKKDTLKMTEIINNPGSLNGKWRSTTPLFNNSGDEVALVFEFKNSVGKLSLVEPNGNICSAPLRADVFVGRFFISQTGVNACKNNDEYHSYTFDCYTGHNDNVQCNAQNTRYLYNKFTFNLVRIK